jgi:polyhydroxybutyrate depolymerase
MHRRFWVSTALLALVAASAHGNEGRQTLIVGGITRSYTVRAPTHPIEDRAGLPLVLVFHGGGGNAANAEQMTGFTEKARGEGFIVVYPEGSGRLRNRLLTWNVGHCCGYAMKERIDDVAFVNALIDEMIRRYPIDARRVYATGMSNGGMMAHRAAIELPNRIAAIAPVVGTLFGDEKRPIHPVSALMINGALDENVPPAGGAPGGRGTDAWDGTPARPALEQATFWASANGCDENAVKSDKPAFIEWKYSCPAGRDVQLVLVKDNGHAWPGGQPGSRRGDKPSSAFQATDAIWDFFRTHPK